MSFFVPYTYVCSRLDNFYKKRFYYSLILSIQNVRYNSSVSDEEGDGVRYFMYFSLFLSTFWNWAAFTIFNMYEENELTWDDWGFPTLRVLYFYLFWLFFGIVYKKFMHLLKDQYLPIDFLVITFLLKISYLLIY